MLTRLSIRNIVLIEALDLTFGRGLGVLTGETGAGKSILLDALGLVLGNRADSGLVRGGEDKASVSASFEFATLPRALAERLDDADIELALRNAAWGAYLHQGQICMSTERIIVVDDPAFAEVIVDQGADGVGEINKEVLFVGLVDRVPEHGHGDRPLTRCVPGQCPVDRGVVVSRGGCAV